MFRTYDDWKTSAPACDDERLSPEDQERDFLAQQQAEEVEEVATFKGRGCFGNSCFGPHSFGANCALGYPNTTCGGAS